MLLVSLEEKKKRRRRLVEAAKDTLTVGHALVGKFKFKAEGKGRGNDIICMDEATGQQPELSFLSVH